MEIKEELVVLNNVGLNVFHMIKKFVDFIIPRTPFLAKLYGSVMYYGARDLLIDEYILWIIENYKVPSLNMISETRASKDGLSKLTMRGYYSEWYGYGSTRLNNLNQRILESYPLSWEQAGYPGPSLSYIPFVKQYKQTKK